MKLKKFYITFGMGSFLGGSYLIAYTDDENNLRKYLSENYRNIWAGIYSEADVLHTNRFSLLQQLPCAFEVFKGANDELHAGVCPFYF